MIVPWEISAALAATALLAFGLVAALTGFEARRTLRKVAELAAAAQRHLPAIRQNIDEIHRNASALAGSLEALSRRAAATSEGFEVVNRDLRRTVQILEAGLVEPGLKIMRAVSTLLAFNTLIRRLGRHVGSSRVRKGRA